MPGSAQSTGGECWCESRTICKIPPYSSRCYTVVVSYSVQGCRFLQTHALLMARQSGLPVVLRLPAPVQFTMAPISRSGCSGVAADGRGRETERVPRRINQSACHETHTHNTHSCMAVEKGKCKRLKIQANLRSVKRPCDSRTPTRDNWCSIIVSNGRQPL